jgi:hypothetical protein
MSLLSFVQLQTRCEQIGSLCGRDCPSKSVVDALAIEGCGDALFPCLLFALRIWFEVLVDELTGGACTKLQITHFWSFLTYFCQDLFFLGRDFGLSLLRLVSLFLLDLLGLHMALREPV